MKALSQASISAVRNYVGQKVKADKVKVSMVDTLESEGVTAAMCEAPAKGEPREFYDSLKAAVVSGFTATVQGLLEKPTKGLTDQQKSDKRYWQQQIGSVIKDIRKALTTREAREGANETSTWEDRTRKALSGIIDAVQKKEGVKIDNIPEFIKTLKSAVARIQ
jgi:hypothetical protein